MEKYLNSTGLTYFWNRLKNYFVKQESGKGLSTNDYTTAEKSKLSGVASGAQVNIIEQVKVNGNAITPSSKAVNITVPTKTSQLTNDSGYITSAQRIYKGTTDTGYEGTGWVDGDLYVQYEDEDSGGGM